MTLIGEAVIGEAVWSRGNGAPAIPIKATQEREGF